jgi:hypothetical protein
LRGAPPQYPDAARRPSGGRRMEPPVPPGGGARGCTFSARVHREPERKKRAPGALAYINSSGGILVNVLKDAKCG